MIRYAMVRDKIISHLTATGMFASVNGHQPLSLPSSPATAAVWAGPVDVVSNTSGLGAVKLRLIVFVSIYVPLDDPLDQVESTIVDSSTTVVELVCGDFELGSTVECVDLLGSSGQAIGAQLGYAQIDSRSYRTSTVTIPLILADTDDIDETP